MEAGLACPDWPLCFGSFFPGRQMNLQVFLEWFHRLDAFFVGLLLILQLAIGLNWRAELPRWLLLTYSFLVFLVICQGILGALTVSRLLLSDVVTAHLALALVLVAVMSGLTQHLLTPKNQLIAPLWWRLMGFGSLSLVLFQSLLGGRMASTWAAQLCLSNADTCQLLDLHRFFAIFAASCILMFVLTSFFAGGWTRDQWPFLLSVALLVAIQVLLGQLSIRFSLSQPLLTVGHQLIAALLVALLAAMCFRKPTTSTLLVSDQIGESLLEHCHG